MAEVQRLAEVQKSMEEFAGLKLNDPKHKAASEGYLDWVCQYDSEEFYDRMFKYSPPEHAWKIQMDLIDKILLGAFLAGAQWFSASLAESVITGAWKKHED